MVELKKISKFDLPKAVRIAYEGDAELFEKYHVGKFDLDGAVASTLNMIFQMVEWEDLEMDYYSVMFNGEAIGYICTYPNNLYSFGINKKYRKKEVLLDWWEAVKSIFNGKFITMLYPNNTRAIRFLKKMGMVEVDGVENNCITLLNL